MKNIINKAGSLILIFGVAYVLGSISIAVYETQNKIKKPVN